MSRPSKPSEQDLKKLIKYQYAQVRKATNAEARADEIRKLKALVSEIDTSVKDMRFGSDDADASEFLLPILDTLFEENPLISKSYLSPAIPDRSLKNSEAIEQKSSIGLAMSSSEKTSQKISELLNAYQSPETLSQDNSFGFEVVGRNTTKTVTTNKKTSISVRENTREFVLTANRFAYNPVTHRRDKIRNPIELDDVELAVENPSEGSRTTKTFEASAFILHIGSLNGGHYTAYVKERDGWYLYNDSSRTGPVDEDALEAAKSSAYIIKYSEKSDEIDLTPNDQSASKNLGNTCWANSALALAGSFKSFDYCQKISLDGREQDLFRTITGSLAAETVKPKALTKPAVKHLTDANNQEDLVADFINCFDNFGFANFPFFSYYQNDGTEVSYYYDESSQTVDKGVSGGTEKTLSFEELKKEVKILATFVANISPEQPARNPLEQTFAAAKKPPATVAKSTDKTISSKQPAATKKRVSWAEPLASEPTIEKVAEKLLQQVNGNKKPEKPILKTPTKTPKKVSIKIVEETKKTAAPEKVSKYSLKSKEALYEKVGPTKSKALSALEAAAAKIKVLKAKIIPENLSEDLEKSLLEITAKAIESRAAKAQQIISKPNNQINALVLKENYQRHTRCDFNGVDFSAAFMNSFANCKFTGNCNFGNSTINKPKFANCVFDDSLNAKQAKEISKLDPQNLIGCKFGENFVKSLGGNAEQEAFKKSLGIKGKANSEGFYEVPKPNQILKPLTVFQLKVPTKSKSF